MKINSIINCIGNTYLKRLNNIYTGHGELWAKMEYLNPGGSIKDRPAYQIIKEAYEKGLLKKGQTVIEMTSGNMGSGLAIVCKAMGNPFIAVMSEGNSIERRKILKALGAEIILFKQSDGAPGKVTGKDIQVAQDFAEKLSKDNNYFYVDQFNNIGSINAHYYNTGPEIYKDLNKIDCFVSSIGSGGTYIGISKYLKEQNNNIKCYPAEPKLANILKSGKVTNSQHIIQGTGYSIIPPFWKGDINKLIDGYITVSDEEADECTKQLSEKEGCFVGYSSGANVAAAIKILETSKRPINVVTILCDTGFKYGCL